MSGAGIPLLSPPAKLPPIKLTKQLPSRDYQIQHLLEKFKTGEAQLIEPLVKGALIYKEQMQEKARIRNSLRKRSSAGISAMLREARRKMNRRQPRSRREIVNSLQQMMEADLVEVSADLHQEKPKVTPRRDKAPSLAPVRPPANHPAHVGTRDKLTKTDSVPETSQSPSKTVRFSHDVKKKSLRNLQPSTVISAVKSPTGSSKSPVLPAINEAQKSAEEEKQDVSELETNPAESSKVEPEQTIEPISAPSSAKLEYQRREVTADPSSPTKLPPLAKPELKRHTPTTPTTPNANTRWDMAINEEKHVMPGRSYVNDRVSTEWTKQLLSSNSGFDDYETSDVSLNILEKRIKSFFTEHDKHMKTSRRGQVYKEGEDQFTLPPLRRYNLDLQDEDVTIPKPGGKVWIRKRLCRFANSSVKVKDHEHVRYHMVPELPRFQEVRKARAVMHRFLAASQSPEKTTANQQVNPFANTFASSHL